MGTAHHAGDPGDIGVGGYRLLLSRTSRSRVISHCCLVSLWVVRRCTNQLSWLAVYNLCSHKISGQHSWAHIFLEVTEAWDLMAPFRYSFCHSSFSFFLFFFLTFHLMLKDSGFQNNPGCMTSWNFTFYWELHVSNIKYFQWYYEITFFKLIHANFSWLVNSDSVLEKPWMKYNCNSYVAVRGKRHISQDS